MNTSMPSSPFLDALSALENLNEELNLVLQRTTRESPALVFKRLEEVKENLEHSIKRLTPPHHSGRPNLEK